MLNRVGRIRDPNSSKIFPGILQEWGSPRTPLYCREHHIFMWGHESMHACAITNRAMMHFRSWPAASPIIRLYLHLVKVSCFHFLACRGSICLVCISFGSNEACFEVHYQLRDTLVCEGYHLFQYCWLSRLICVPHQSCNPVWLFFIALSGFRIDTVGLRPNGACDFVSGPAFGLIEVCNCLVLPSHAHWHQAWMIFTEEPKVSLDQQPLRTILSF